MKKVQKKSIADFQEQFASEEACLAYFAQLRFPGGSPICPHCEHKDAYPFKDGRYRCAKCKKDFNIKTGTIFAGSKIPLSKWFMAIYLLTTAKKGISSIDLAAKVGVSQKTGWYMDHRIREAMQQEGGIFSGSVEIDESYVGGKEKNKHASKRTGKTQGRSTATKTPILGTLTRGDEMNHSKIKVKVIENVKRVTLEREIIDNVALGSKLYTDKFLSYANVGILYPHETVDHGKGEYVRGDAHTNGIESVWATFKRGYVGTYHYMSKKHLQRYVNEFVYRFNDRMTDFDVVFANLLTRVAETETVKYKTLTQSV